MNLFSPFAIKVSWVGLTALALISGVLLLARPSRIRNIVRALPWILITLGALLFLVSALELFQPIKRPILQWIYSASSESSLRVGFSIDHLSGWALGIMTLLMLIRASASEMMSHVSAAIAFSLAGWIACWTAETIWISLLGFTVILVSGFLVSVSANASEREPARFIKNDLTRIGVAIGALWTSAAGLEVVGFSWNFQGSATHSVLVILIPLFLIALLLLVLPWSNLSSLTRPEEKLESDSLPFMTVFLPLAVSASLFRVFSGVVGSFWMRGAGLTCGVFGGLFFVIYLASKTPMERKRAITLLFGSLVLAISFIEPIALGLLFALSLGALVALLVIGFAGVNFLVKRSLLMIFLLIAAGMPGFVPGAFLTHLWSHLPNRPVELGLVLLLHGLLTIALLREVAVAFHERVAETVSGVPLSLAIVGLYLFILSPWSTGTLSGGFLGEEFDRIVAFQGLPWLQQLGMTPGPQFEEGKWIQLANALLFPLMIFVFGSGDPFRTGAGSWLRFRKILAADLGIRWLLSKFTAGFAWMGRFLEERIFSRIWSSYLPAAGDFLGKGRERLAGLLDGFTNRLTDERWNHLIAAPSYLIEAMTNGGIHWYLYFTILGTFVLAIHFVLKLS